MRMSKWLQIFKFQGGATLFLYRGAETRSVVNKHRAVKRVSRSACPLVTDSFHGRYVLTEECGPWDPKPHCHPLHKPQPSILGFVCPLLFLISSAAWHFVGLKCTEDGLDSSSPAVPPVINSRSFALCGILCLAEERKRLFILLVPFKKFSDSFVCCHGGVCCKGPRANLGLCVCLIEGVVTIGPL